MKERGNPFLKKLDFYIGVPLLFVLSLFRRRNRRIPREIRVIGLLKSSAIGDTVLLSPMVSDLQKAFPGARVIFFAGGSNFRAAELLVGDRHVVALPMLRPWEAVKRLRELKIDVLIDADSWPRINALITFASGARFCIGFKTLGQGRHFGYDLAVQHSFVKHEIENYRELVRPLGVTDFSEPRIAMEVERDEKLILFHPWPGGSRSEEKRWPDENWAQLANELLLRGYRVGVSTGPGDLEKSQALRALCNEGVDVVRPASLVELLRVVAGSTLIVAVDTGVAHLAGAVGQKTLVLHGPTSPQRWGARGPRVRYLKDSQPASVNLGFEEVMGHGVDLKPEMVLEAALALLTAEKLIR